MAGRRRKKGTQPPISVLDFGRLQDDVERLISRGQTALGAASMAIQLGLEKAQQVATAASTIQDARTHVDIACRALVRFCIKNRVSKQFAVHTLSRAFDMVTDTSKPSDPDDGSAPGSTS